MKLSIVTKVYPVWLQFVKNKGKSDEIQIQFDALRNTFNLVDKAKHRYRESLLMCYITSFARFLYL